MIGKLVLVLSNGEVNYEALGMDMPEATVDFNFNPLRVDGFYVDPDKETITIYINGGIASILYNQEIFDTLNMLTNGVL